jgi:folate-binding protein YgfZ
MTEAAQLDALLHGAAFAQITDRAFLRVTGADATRWLNGMVTNNVAALAPGEGNYNFLLNAQGRIQGDCTLYREPGDGPATFLLETQNSQLETIHKTFDHYIIMDDVELTQVMSEHNGLLLLGPGAINIIDGFYVGAGDSLRMFEFPSVDGTTTKLFSPAPGTVPQFELFDLGHFEFPNATQISPETLEAFRIYSGTPKFGTDIRDKDLPQETGQTHALHFSKGCYLGQEIVERIRSRGQVHRQFTQFTLTGEMPQTFPAPIEANGKACRRTHLSRPNRRHNLRTRLR